MAIFIKLITTETQKQRIRLAFEAGRRMTSHEANKVGRTVDARKYISDLRASGLDIQDTRERSNDGRTFKRYFLSEAALAEIRNNKKL